MVVSVEQIQHIFEGLERPAGNRWFLHTLAQGRLHLSVNHDGRPTVFIEGTTASFGRLPVFKGIEHREDAIDVQTGKSFQALRITSPNELHGHEALAVIAYEISRTVGFDPDSDNTTLLAKVNWILTLLGKETSVLSGERQRGLVAELLLLRRLFRIGRDQDIGPHIVLDRWWGPSGGKRDFAASEISIEVKSTALNTRTHYIASIDQLEPTSCSEQAYLYSVGIKSEPTNNRKLPTYVADAVNGVVDANGLPVTTAVQVLYEKLKSAGYESQFDDLYSSEPGLVPNPLMPPRLFRLDELDRVRISSFKGDQLPSMVTAVSYEINVSASPLTEHDMDSVLISLLTSPAI